MNPPRDAAFLFTTRLLGGAGPQVSAALPIDLLAICSSFRFLVIGGLNQFREEVVDLCRPSRQRAETSHRLQEDYHHCIRIVNGFVVQYMCR